MSRITGRKRRTVAPAAFVLILACLALAACGSSSKSSSSTTASASASTSPSAKGAAKGAAGAKRFTAVRECLQKDGITLPKRTPGKRPGGTSGPAGGFLGGAGGGPTLPKGVTRAQYEAAIKKCGGFGTRRFGAGGAGRGFNSPTVKQALEKFATCMRANGVNVPAPNTSGKGPVFNTKGLDPTSAKFKAAQTKCASDLTSTFRARPGAGGAPAGAGTPPPSAG
jgi:hypothetical protein